jgi:hypothetical protein
MLTINGFFPLSAQGQDKWKNNPTLNNAPGGLIHQPMPPQSSKPPQMMNHLSQMPNHLSQMPNQMNAAAMLGHTFNNGGTGLGNGAPGMPQMQMPPMSGMYDHLHPNMNGVGVPKPPPPVNEPFLYMGGQQQAHLNMMHVQNQFLNVRNNSSVSD